MTRAAVRVKSELRDLADSPANETRLDDHLGGELHYRAALIETSAETIFSKPREPQ
jgi:hypothetical protein